MIEVPTTYEELDALVAALEGTNPQDNPLLHIGDDNVRGGGTYLSDVVAQPKYKANEVQALADIIRNSGLQLQDGNTVYTTSNPAVNEALYGPDISRNISYANPGFQTPRQFQSDGLGGAIRDGLFDFVGAAIGAAIPGAAGAVLGDGLLGNVIGSALGNAADNAVSDLPRDNGQLNITGGQNSQGGMVDLGETENPANGGWLDGLLSSGGGISLPIPGLPVSLPGNMTIGDLMDIARATGRPVMDVISDIMNSGGETVSDQEPVDAPIIDPPAGGTSGDPVETPDVTPIETPSDPVSDPVGDSEEPTSPYDPTWPDWGVSDPFPNTPPPQDVNENPEDPVVPITGGTTGGGVSGGDIAAGLGLILPGLIALQNDPAPTPEYEMWDYIGPDTSYGYETPDYGQVTQKPLYDFAKQPSQPNQVGYQPDPRRDYLNVLQQEQKRRQQIGLLG